MFGWVRKIFAGKPERRESVRATYDAAQTNDDNRRHWAKADDLSADSANSPMVRRILRKRARYEFRNNSILNGMMKTLANHAVGTGPRLQLTTEDVDFNQFVSNEFEKWLRAIKLPKKLRLMRIGRAVDGEAFAVKRTNPKLRTPVKLDITLIEPEQVTTPDLAFDDPNAIDGIRFDEDGNPIEYHVLKRHPGDTRGLMDLMQYDRVPAEFMIHRFTPLRPGEHRGVPEIGPALPLGSNGRRYTLAVLGAAEVAADFAAVAQSQAGASEDDEDVKPFVTLELEKRMMTVLPKGWQLGQLKSEQPTTSYKEFKRGIVSESARCISMPYNIAACDSSDYNYASGRMDHQVYFGMVEVEQDDDEDETLTVLFRDWMKEARKIQGYMPATNVKIDQDLSHEWRWPGREHVDPQKEANAQQTRLQNRTTTLRDEWAKQGADWKEKLAQIAEEQKFMREHDILPQMAAPPAPEPDDDDIDEDEDEDKTQDKKTARRAA